MQTEKLLERATGGLEEVGESWMSGSRTRALVLGDPALVWLEYYGEQFDLERDPEAYSLFNFICQKGCEFERKWVSEMVPEAVQIMENDWDVRKQESFQKTLDALARKEKVMTKVPLWWKKEKIYGSADVIIHTSTLYKKFPKLKPEKPEPDHYVVIDLKMTSHLDSPAKADDLLAASNQVRIYSFILGNLVNFMPKRAFLFTRTNITQPIIVSVEQELNKPLSADLRGYRRDYAEIKLHGDKMKPWDAKDTLVKPNFGNKKDAPWSDAKKEIEEERIPGRSLTLLPGVGPKLADALMEKGYKSLDDLLSKKPASLPLEDIPGIGEIMAKRMRAVLEANRSHKPTAFSPDIVPRKAAVELFVDFETFNNLNINFDKQWPDISKGETGGLEGTAMCFAIGVGWAEGRTWHYKSFVAEKESHAAEKKMWREFLDFLDKRGAFDPAKDVALYHWTSAEPRTVKEAFERHHIAGLKKLLDADLFVDLYEVFANDGPIGLPNCWNYQLKSIANAISESDPALSH